MDEVLSTVKQMLANPTGVTANRMSIINGLYDMTEYGMAMQTGIRDFLAGRNDYGVERSELSICMAMVISSEIDYQRNNCYDALVNVNSALAFLEKTGYGEIWTAAKYIQMCIMIVTGQVRAVAPLVNGMQRRVATSQNPELICNYESLRAWCALYDDDWAVIDDWMEHEAPNEFASMEPKEFFRFFIKARIYFMQERYMAAMSLLQAMITILAKRQRAMGLCEAYMLLALTQQAMNQSEDAYDSLSRSLEIAKERGFKRLLADEGEPMYRLLVGYLKRLEKESPLLSFAQEVRKLSQEMALLYPCYLRNHKSDYPALTNRELEILRLMGDGRRNPQIAEFLDCSINTIKFHVKNIYLKLGVNKRSQALKIAREEQYIP